MAEGTYVAGVDPRVAEREERRRRRKEKRRERRRRRRERQEAGAPSSSSSDSSDSDGSGSPAPRAGRGGAAAAAAAAAAPRSLRREQTTLRVETPEAEKKLFLGAIAACGVFLVFVATASLGGVWSQSDSRSLLGPVGGSATAIDWSITRYDAQFSPELDDGFSTFGTTYSSARAVALFAVENYNETTGTTTLEDGTEVAVDVDAYRNEAAVMEDLSNGGRVLALLLIGCAAAAALAFAVIVADRRSALMRPVARDPETGATRVVYANSINPLYWTILVTVTLVACGPALSWRYLSHEKIHGFFGADSSQLRLVNNSLQLGWCWAVAVIMPFCFVVPWLYFCTRQRRLHKTEGTVPRDVAAAL